MPLRRQLFRLRQFWHSSTLFSKSPVGALGGTLAQCSRLLTARLIQIGGCGFD
jgi:hypothetical protein